MKTSRSPAIRTTKSPRSRSRSCAPTGTRWRRLTTFARSTALLIEGMSSPWPTRRSSDSIELGKASGSMPARTKASRQTATAGSATTFLSASDARAIAALGVKVGGYGLVRALVAEVRRDDERDAEVREALDEVGRELELHLGTSRI